jgi:hypothetical protein
MMCVNTITETTEMALYLWTETTYSTAYEISINPLVLE